jgi:anaerobic magnesium-protoporphyrin IX monomethyl ester cyclase
MFLIWGYDGEEISDIEATVDHVRQCSPDIFFTTVSYPIKGTPYFDKVADRLVSLGSWHERTDRDFKIRGRHSRTFYQHAEELLRSETAEHVDISRVAAARAALHETASEVEV